MPIVNKITSTITTTRNGERESGLESGKDELSATDWYTATGKCCGSRYNTLHIVNVNKLDNVCSNVYVLLFIDCHTQLLYQGTASHF